MLHLLAQMSNPNFGGGPNNANPAIFAGAMGLCVLVFALAMLVVVIFVWGTIFKKAGYSFWMALLMIIPLVNLIWLIVFAFTTWPIEQELQALRAGRGGSPGGTGFPLTPPPPR